MARLAIHNMMHFETNGYNNRHLLHEEQSTTSFSNNIVVSVYKKNRTNIELKYRVVVVHFTSKTLVLK